MTVSVLLISICKCWVGLFMEENLLRCLVVKVSLLGQDGWYWPSSLSRFYAPRRSRYNKNAKKKEFNIQPSWLVSKASLKKEFIIWKRTFSRGTNAEISSGQYMLILHAWVANQNTGFSSSCPLADSAIIRFKPSPGFKTKQQRHKGAKLNLRTKVVFFWDQQFSQRDWRVKFAKKCGAG